MPRSGKAEEIARTLARSLPRIWDGKACVLELKAADYQWRQLEWIGWWFEFKALQGLRSSMGGGVGPRLDSVKFDYSVDGEIWDFKAHPVGSGKSTGAAYLNDEQAVNECLANEGHIGWQIAVGAATYDDERGSFKAWHDALKGKESVYVREGKLSGRRSRRRKVSFQFQGIAWFEFRSGQELEMALKSGWLTRGMQVGQRNADGSPRRAKYGYSHGRWREYVSGGTPALRCGWVEVGD